MNGDACWRSREPARVAVEGLPDNWAVKSILLDNEDVTDRLIEASKQAAEGPARRAHRQGHRRCRIDRLGVRFSDGGNAAQAIVLVFADDDEAKWAYPSRFIRTARSDRRAHSR